MNKEEREEYENLANEIMEFSTELFDFVKKKPKNVGMGAMVFLLAEHSENKNGILSFLSGLCDFHEKVQKDHGHE